jgi:hypothetical protein
MRNDPVTRQKIAELASKASGGNGNVVPGSVTTASQGSSQGGSSGSSGSGGSYWDGTKFVNDNGSSGTIITGITVTDAPIAQLNQIAIVPSLYRWQYYKTISISNSCVKSNLDNFTLYVAMHDADIGAACLPSGSDIRFSDISGNILDYEIESFAVSDGVAIGVFWVKVSRIFADYNTTIACYYGNSAATESVSTSAAWDSNYTGVYHLDTFGSNATTDSTSNANNGVVTNVTTTDGKIGDAAYFNGTADIAINRTIQDNFTCSFWAKCTSNSLLSGYGTAFIDARGTSPYFAVEELQGRLYFYAGTGSAGIELSSTDAINDGTWKHLAVTRDTSTGLYRLYINGFLQASRTVSNTTSLNGTTHIKFGGGNGICGRLTGPMDEVHLSNIARSNDWIGFEHCNQSYNQLSWSESNYNPGYKYRRAITIQATQPVETYYNADQVTLACATSGLLGVSSILNGKMNYDTATINKIASIIIPGSSVKDSSQAYYTPNPPITASYGYAGDITRLCINSGLPGAGSINITDGEMRNDPATCLKVAQIALGPTGYVVPGSIQHSGYSSPGDNFLSYWDGSQFICGNAGDLGNDMIDGITVERPGDPHYLSYWDGSQFVTVVSDTIGNNMINSIGLRDTSSHVTDFPLLVRINDADIGAVCQSSGADIRFTDTIGNTLHSEIDNFSVVNGVAIGSFWVRVPRIELTTTTMIYCYYGCTQSATVFNYDVVKTWEPNFKCVWHMGDGETLKIADATENSNLQTSVSTATADIGVIGGAASFAGNNSDIIKLGTRYLGLDKTYTIGFWIRSMQTAPVTDYSPWGVNLISSIYVANQTTLWSRNFAISLAAANSSSYSRTFNNIYETVDLCRNSGLPGAGNIIDMRQGGAPGGMRLDYITMDEIAKIAYGPDGYVVPGSETYWSWFEPDSAYISYWDGSQFICQIATVAGNYMIEKLTVAVPTPIVLTASSSGAGSNVAYSTTAMTSFNTPAHAVYVSSSGALYAEINNINLYGWYAFDQNLSNPYGWAVMIGGNSYVPGNAFQHPMWITYDFGSSKIIDKYAFYTKMLNTALPKDWTLWGSNDNSNWTLLDSQIDVTPPLSTGVWTDYFTFDNRSAYRYYKINVTACTYPYYSMYSSDSFWYCIIGQIKFVEQTQTSANMTYIHGSSGIADNAWKYCTAVQNDSTKQLQLYINGSLVARSTYPSAWPITTNSEINVGGGSTNYIGLMDEVRFASAARSAQWVSLEYINIASGGLSWGATEHIA